MRVTGHIEHMQRLQGEFTHVLFSDAWDVLFTAPLSEIISKYEQAGSPPFLLGACAATSGLMNIHDPSEYEHYFSSCLYRYPSTSFYFAEIPYAIDTLSLLPGISTHDESASYMQAIRGGWLQRVTMDHTCEIFQEQPEYCEIADGRLRNTHTGTSPCMIHLGGGYVDSEYGKDDTIRPWAEQLGIL